MMVKNTNEVHLSFSDKGTVKRVPMVIYFKPL